MPDELALLFDTPFGYVMAGLWGAMWGSFFNVCIYRIGLHESIVRPRSRCPHCGTPVRARDNIPILSWLWLRGRCRSCGAPISLRYPAVEALSAALAVLVWTRYAAGSHAFGSAIAHFLIVFAFVGTLIVLAGIDVDHKLLPDRVTYPAIPIFLVAAILLRDTPREELLVGAVIGYAMVAFVIEIVYAIIGVEAMGYGDAKLLALVGGFLGWRAVVVTFFVSPFFALAVMLPILMRRGKVRGVQIPYGPFLIGGALVYLFLLRGVEFGDLVL